MESTYSWDNGVALGVEHVDDRESKHYTTGDYNAVRCRFVEPVVGGVGKSDDQERGAGDEQHTEVRVSVLPRYEERDRAGDTYSPEKSKVRIISRSGGGVVLLSFKLKNRRTMARPPRGRLMSDGQH